MEGRDVDSFVLWRCPILSPIVKEWLIFLIIFLLLDFSNGHGFFNFKKLGLFLFQREMSLNKNIQTFTKI